MKKKINFINYLKAFASFSVTAVHFRQRTERLIPELSVTPFIKLFYSLDYSIFISAVPIFLLITGYLSINAKPTKKYYLKIMNVYLLYVFIAISSYSLLMIIGLRESLPLIEFIQKIMSFDLVSGWYIEAYIGLAIIIPYLNIITKSISKKDFRNLIFSLLIIVSVPAFVNKNPLLSKIIYLPNFYSNMYPIVYFLTGAYIRKFEDVLKIDIRKIIISIFAMIVLVTAILFFSANPYTYTADGYYPSILEVVLSISIFLLFMSFKSLRSNTFIDLVSKYSLSTYIMSLPVDRVLYPIFTNIAGGELKLIKSSVIVVIVAFLTALITGVIFTKIYEMLSEILIVTVQKLKR